MKGRAIIISAPSGAGKTTIVHRLMQQGLGLAFSVSATTRPQRPNEMHGKDYLFLTEAEFRERIAQGGFVEWEEVYPGRFYGTLRSEVDRICGSGQNPIFDVDVEGGLNLKAYFGADALAIFIAPPSLQALEQRLRTRGTETEESLRKRVDKAAHELTYAARFDAVVVNDDLDQACTQTLGLVRAFLG